MTEFHLTCHVELVSKYQYCAGYAGEQKGILIQYIYSILLKKLNSRQTADYTDVIHTVYGRYF